MARSILSSSLPFKLFGSTRYSPTSGFFSDSSLLVSSTTTISRTKSFTMSPNSDSDRRGWFSTKVPIRLRASECLLDHRSWPLSLSRQRRLQSFPTASPNGILAIRGVIIQKPLRLTGSLSQSRITGVATLFGALMPRAMPATDCTEG